MTCRANATGLLNKGSKMVWSFKSIFSTRRMRTILWFWENWPQILRLYIFLTLKQRLTKSLTMKYDRGLSFKIDTFFLGCLWYRNINSEVFYLDMFFIFLSADPAKAILILEITQNSFMYCFNRNNNTWETTYWYNEKLSNWYKNNTFLNQYFFLEF